MTETAKRVIITGAAGALGAAVARAFMTSGALLALFDRAADSKELLKGAAAPHFFIGGVDLTDFEQARRAMDTAVSRLGGIDVLVNIAGGFRWETIAEGSLGTWDFMYSINLKTAVCACKAALAHLPQGAGRIINVGAAATAKAGIGMGAYTASKAGVAKLTEALAEELKDKGINVNAVLPTIIDTPANRADMPTADFTRWVDPQALADVIVFLSSHGARAITGASILVAGRV
ncbi:MAG TPA: SDR family NAD(P)-dependent oxidoreductase [Steroidobacteraceae bacterium]|nr:SDR family NAD(P)-dependent oxidoreductase [Steroidobacteraceae bacterium]